MKLSRRSFLKLGGAAAAAAIAAPVIEQVTAPLFIPAERLELGVPRALIVPEQTITINTWSYGTSNLTFEGVEFYPTEPVRVPSLTEYRAAMAQDMRQHSTSHPMYGKPVYIMKADGVYAAEYGYVDPKPADGVIRLPNNHVIETRHNGRGFADLVDRSYEEEIRQAGEPYQFDWQDVGTPSRRQLAEALVRGLEHCPRDPLAVD